MQSRLAVLILTMLAVPLALRGADPLPPLRHPGLT